MTSDTKASPPKDVSSGLFPPEIQRLMVDSAATRALAVGAWPKGVRHQCSDPDSIYHGYPYLFLDAFPDLKLAQVEPLARGAGLIFDSIIVADRVMDEETEHITGDVLGIEVMQFEGYRLLHPLIESTDPFWNRFRDYWVAYTEACLLERELASPEASWERFTEAQAVSVAVGKCGLAKVSVAGLAALAKDDRCYEPLTQSIERYYTARQMLDDLTDWRADLESGFPSLLLSRVTAAAFAGDRRQLRADGERTRREIYYGGHVGYTMRLALEAIAESERLTEGYPDLLWHRQTSAIRERCQAVLQQLEHIAEKRQATTRRLAVALPPPSDAWQEVAWDAVQRILHRWGASGGRRPTDAGRDVTSKVGDVLPLAMAADALCDVDSLLEGQLQPLIQSQVDYLVYRRRPGGGWSYSAVSMGLPADSDHLGLILRILLRAGRREDAEQHCAQLLSQLEDFGVLRPDGAVETWIRRSPQGETLPVGEPDAAVTAQLLEALALFDGQRFAEPIERGLTWLEEQQQADGSWRSSAYRGLYPTVACLRCLVALRSTSSVVGRAESFLRQAWRSADWGASASDAMSAALALQGLALAQGRARVRTRAIDLDELERAQSLLQRIQGVSGICDLTTAFVLRSAVLWHRLARASTMEEATP